MFDLSIIVLTILLPLQVATAVDHALEAVYLYHDQAVEQVRINNILKRSHNNNDNNNNNSNNDNKNNNNNDGNSNNNNSGVELTDFTSAMVAIINDNGAASDNNLQTLSAGVCFVFI